MKRKLKSEEVMKICLDNKVCLRCFGNDHKSKNCQSTNNCWRTDPTTGVQCKGGHHHQLHALFNKGDDYRKSHGTTTGGAYGYSGPPGPPQPRNPAPGNTPNVPPKPPGYTPRPGAPGGPPTRPPFTPKDTTDNKFKDITSRPPPPPPNTQPPGYPPGTPHSNNPGPSGTQNRKN